MCSVCNFAEIVCLLICLTSCLRGTPSDILHDSKVEVHGQ